MKLILRLSDGVIILLINVKMPTLVGILFNFYGQDKFHAHLS